MAVLRVYEASAATTVASAGAVLRVYSASAATTTAIILNDLADVTGVEPLTNVTLTVTTQQGIATSYVWRVVSAPAGASVTFTGAGPTRTFRAPGLIAGGTFVIGVRGQNGANLSPEVTATVIVLPQITWNRVHLGTWKPYQETFKPATVSSFGSTFDTNF